MGKEEEEPTFEELIEKLQGKNNLVRKRDIMENFFAQKSAAKAVVTLGDARAVEPLIELLQKDEDWIVRSYAAEILGKLGFIQAFEPLITSLQDTYDWGRRETAEAMGNIGNSREVESLIDFVKKGIYSEDDPTNDITKMLELLKYDEN